MLTYVKLTKYPELFENLTGISVDHFDEIRHEVYQKWGYNEYKRLWSDNRQREVGGGRSYKNKFQSQLLMTLIWLHMRLNLEVVGLLFDVHKSTVNRNTHRVYEALVWVQRRNRFIKPVPTPPQRGNGRTIDELFEMYPELQSILEDGE